MPAVDAHAQVLQEPDLAAASAVPVVAREIDEVDVVDDRDGAGEVGDEDDRRLERGDQDGLEALVVGGDLGPELFDPRLDLLGGEVRLADPRIG
jgi:hypothetical protein